MSLSDEERGTICTLKLRKSETAYSEMLANFDMGLYSTAANRLYYAAFYACSALLVNDGLEAHTHSGNLSLINLHFIRTGRIDSEYGRMLRGIFRLRQDSDYDDYFSVEKENLEEYIKPVSEFIQIVKQIVSSEDVHAD